MSCDPSTLLASANCILECLTIGQMDAINSSILCGIANTTGNFVLKAGDQMTGNLLMSNTKRFQSGLSPDADINAVVANPYAAFFGSSIHATSILCRYSNDSSGPSITSFKTRSTISTNASQILLIGDSLLFLAAEGADGASYIECAQISFALDAAPGVGSMPGKIVFWTTLDGTTTLTIRWNVTSAGLLSGLKPVLINQSTPIPVGGTAGVGYMFSATANFGMFFGSGIPALSAAQGSWYSRSDGSGTTDRAYINIDGAVGWTAVTTVA